MNFSESLTNPFSWRFLNKINSSRPRLFRLLLDSSTAASNNVLKIRLDSRCSVQCIGVKSAWVGQSLILQVAKKASVLKRRKSRNRMDVPPSTPLQMETGSTAIVASQSKCDSDNEVVCYSEEPKAGG